MLYVPLLHNGSSENTLLSGVKEPFSAQDICLDVAIRMKSSDTQLWKYRIMHEDTHTHTHQEAYFFSRMDFRELCCVWFSLRIQTSALATPTDPQDHHPTVRGSFTGNSCVGSLAMRRRLQKGGQGYVCL